MKYFVLFIAILLSISSCKKANLSECVGEKKEPECFLDYSPVCGCDGETYSNTCFAEAAGVKRWAEGECEQISDN